MTPVCKTEAEWLYWRNWNPNRPINKRGYSRWMKNQMARARRRYFKKEDRQTG